MSTSVLPMRRGTPLFMRFSYGLHAGALGLLLWQPGWWPWLLAAVVLDHGVITAAGLWPQSSLLGANWRRLPELAAQTGQVVISIDDGPDPVVTPQVLALLDRHGVKASFFLIGEQAERHPQLVAAIVAAGHSVENHSYSHRHHFSLFGPWRMAAEVARGQDCLTALSGQRPRFFRAPAGLRNPFLEPVLARHGLWLASWTRRGYDTRNADADDVCARLLTGLAAGDILLLHDGHAARTASGQPVILAVLPCVIEAIAQAGLHCVTLPEALLVARLAGEA